MVQETGVQKRSKWSSCRDGECIKKSEIRSMQLAEWVIEHLSFGTAGPPVKPASGAVESQDKQYMKACSC